MAGDVNDLIIVGAGPAGLAAGIFARARSMRVALVEASQAGGQLMALFPEKPLYNIPAVASALAGEYACNLVRQARDEGVELFEGQTVHRLEAAGSDVQAAITDDYVHYGRAVILATGMGQMSPRKLGVPGEAELAGNRLVYAVTSPQTFAGQRVLVVGGGDAAVDNALLLSDVAGKVVLAHRSSSFKAQERHLEMLPVKGVEVLVDVQVRGLQEESDALVARLYCASSGEERTLEIDRVVVNVGLVPNPGPLADWGLQLEGKLIKVDSEMKTNQPGVFACGDAVTYPGKLKMVVTAIGEAATAVNTAFQYLKTRGTP
ncbi:MAG: NAD(P)/FAD-dependent oxidoreductase [Bacteroidetes bacterium]|nr:NAD(P)/FAD-dependent oxidoreductase [Bacteroidota bacterium]MCL5025606.1 NAD(P)/FAD-dependent oxidoreductase [Chloroflexota bacterium]